MSERDGSKFEGMVLAKLTAIERRMEEMLGHVREIQGRCMDEHGAHASLSAEVRALRERTQFNTRVIWAAVTWVVLAAAGMLLAAMGVRM